MNKLLKFCGPSLQGPGLPYGWVSILGKKWPKWPKCKHSRLNWPNCKHGLDKQSQISSSLRSLLYIAFYFINRLETLENANTRGNTFHWLNLLEGQSLGKVGMELTTNTVVCKFNKIRIKGFIFKISILKLYFENWRMVWFNPVILLFDSTSVELGLLILKTCDIV